MSPVTQNVRNVTERRLADAARLWTLLSISVFLTTGCDSVNRNVKAESGAGAASSRTYVVSDGHIEIKPRLKYELLLSFHVLRTAEDHHQLFIPWAQRMRESLAPRTYQQVTKLNARIHEWQLCSLVQDYDGPDTVEGLTHYIRRDAKRDIRKWARLSATTVREVSGGGPDQFAEWLADLVTRYNAEGFNREWPEHCRLVEAQATADLQTFEQLPFSMTEFMEAHTGRKFLGNSKVVFYPSSFSRPQHAYGFTENGSKVVVYKVGDSPVGTAFHELLHPLLHGWSQSQPVRKAVAELGQEPLFKSDVKALRGSYDYPTGCLEELIVHAVANYFSVKAGLLSETAARRQTYGAYENALYDAIFDRYESFQTIDDFIDYAMTHIQPVPQGDKRGFAYIGGERYGATN